MLGSRILNFLIFIIIGSAQAGNAYAQKSYSPGIYPGVNISSAAVAVSGSPTLRPLSSLLADTINPKSFGAIGDGTSHTVQATLGITTAAQLISYTSNGVTPYAFVNTEPFGVRFNLQAAAVSASGVTSLSLAGTGTITSQIEPTVSIAATNTTIQLADLFVTADSTPITVGTHVSAPCLQSGTTVTAISGSLGGYTLTISPAATGACASRIFLQFAVSPAAGVYALPIAFNAGVRQGDLITGASCIPAGTQVDFVNLVKGEIRLSSPTTASCAGGTILTFIPSWLSNVTAGMYVRGTSGIFPSNETVSSVNTSTGVITLSHATIGAIVPTTEITGVASPTYLNTSFTFWRPYTDSEVANLQMDRLGWQAAINSLSSSFGGSVVGSPGQYLIDATLIWPVTQTYYPGVRPQNSIGGNPYSSVSATALLATKDLGPNTAVFSCGDPAATAQNQFGLYQSVGYYCSGSMHDIYFGEIPTVGTTPGERPTWNGSPVAMDGIKQGPRLMTDRVTINGFNIADRFAGDHTYFNYFVAQNSFIGIYFDDSQPGLFGDEYMNNTYFIGNNWAGIMISPHAFLNVQMDKGYLGFNPYGIYCEAGIVGNGCLSGSTFTNLNSESVDCGVIKDGSIADGILPAAYTNGNNSNSINSVKFINSFFGISVNGSNVRTGSFQLAGGCQYNAAFDVGEINGLKLVNMSNPGFAPVVGETALIRTVLSDMHYGTNNGGGVLEGDSLWDLIQSFSIAGVSMVSGPGNLGQDGLFWVGSWQNWRLQGPGWRGIPVPIPYNTLSTYTRGAVMEYTLNSGAVDNVVAIQLAGTTANAPVAGTLCTTGASNPYANNFVPILCTGGSAIPVLTTANPQGVGTMVKVGTTPGTAVVASGMNDSSNGNPPIGIIVRSGTGTLGTMKALFPGAE